MFNIKICQLFSIQRMKINQIQDNKWKIFINLPLNPELCSRFVVLSCDLGSGQFPPVIIPFSTRFITIPTCIPICADFSLNHLKTY